MLTLVWFMPNLAWSFVFHSGDITKGTPISLEGFSRFFSTRGEAEHAALLLGLKVAPKTGRTTVA